MYPHGRVINRYPLDLGEDFGKALSIVTEPDAADERIVARTPRFFEHLICIVSLKESTSAEDSFIAVNSPSSSEAKISTVYAADSVRVWNTPFV